ncbi:MAG: phosphoglycerate mutase [Bacteroidetes bacterium]|nr:MAG: phosphoglycerate mutase [Bacteroidota bacterium]
MAHLIKNYAAWTESSWYEGAETITFPFILPKTPMMKHSLVLLFAILLFAPACTTNYYLVRHAERQDNTSDSPLSPAGHARAEALRDSLQDKGVSYLFASTYLRTQQTARPLATELNKPLIIYRPDTTAGLVKRLKKIRGKKVLVVGHSNTIPDIVQRLTGQVVTIGHDDYDKLFVVRRTRGIGSIKSTLHQSTYGTPSP